VLVSMIAFISCMFRGRRLQMVICVTERKFWVRSCRVLTCQQTFYYAAKLIVLIKYIFNSWINILQTLLNLASQLLNLSFSVHEGKKIAVVLLVGLNIRNHCAINLYSGIIYGWTAITLRLAQWLIVCDALKPPITRPFAKLSMMRTRQ